MQEFITKIDKENGIAECLVDEKIFPTDIIMKAAYEHIDSVFLFFKKTDEGVLVQFKEKEKVNLEDIVSKFNTDLVHFHLRAQIDAQTGDLRTKIITTAIGSGLSLDGVKDNLDDLIAKTNANAEDKIEDKSIDDIISDIKNDPDFDDADDIINTLNEIKNEK